jgi:hypothetical protein
MGSALHLHLLGAASVSVSVKIAVGLMTAPMTWAVTTMLGPMLPHVDCGRGVSFLLIGVSVALAVALFELVTLARKYTTAGREFSFVEKASVGVAPLCVFAMLLQGTAAMLISPCMH